MTIQTSNKNLFYLGTSVKRAGVKIEYTTEQIEEIIKCKKDPIYFMRKYCKIVTLDHGLILFDLYKCQEKVVHTIFNNRKVISMMPRQVGKTTLSAAILLHHALFNDSYTIAIVAHKASGAREVLSRIKNMYELLPFWMMHGIKTWNKGDIALENGSVIITGATTASGLRGRSINFLYCDEAGFIPNNVAEEFFTATYPTISSGKTTKILMTSTPKGYNHFWKFWNDAIHEVNGFIPIQVKYDEVPGRDEAWAKEQLETLGPLMYSQEVLCSFLGSSATLISGDVLNSLSPVRPVYSKDGLDILEEPKDDHSYFIICDTSRGVGGDYSAFVVIDTTEYPYTAVGKYRDNKISPLLYPSIINKIAKDYNDAYVLIEINDIGQQVADIMTNDLEYENIIHVDSMNKRGQFVTWLNVNAKSGVRTTKQVKSIGCANLKSLVDERKLLIFDSDIIAELTTFIETKGSYEADVGYNDDLAMCLVLFGWLSSDPAFRELTNADSRRALYDKRMAEIDYNLTPYGFFPVNNPTVKYEVSGGDIWFSDDAEDAMKEFIDNMID